MNMGYLNGMEAIEGPGIAENTTGCRCTDDKNLRTEMPKYEQVWHTAHQLSVSYHPLFPWPQDLRSCPMFIASE